MGIFLIMVLIAIGALLVVGGNLMLLSLEKAGIIAEIIGILLIALVAVVGGINIGYKSGQVDALTGTIGYELVEYGDSTKSWEKIDEK